MEEEAFSCSWSKTIKVSWGRLCKGRNETRGTHRFQAGPKRRALPESDPLSRLRPPRASTPADTHPGRGCVVAS